MKQRPANSLLAVKNEPSFLFVFSVVVAFTAGYMMAFISVLPVGR